MFAGGEVPGVRHVDICREERFWRCFTLTSYGYGALAGHCSPAIDVGWLDSSEPFAVGPVAADFLDRLLLLTRSPVESSQFVFLRVRPAGDRVARDAEGLLPERWLIAH